MELHELHPAPGSHKARVVPVWVRPPVKARKVRSPVPAV